MQLHQILALETGVRQRATREITALHHITQKAGNMNGLSKTFDPMEEDGERYPPESTHVAYTAQNVLKQVQDHLTKVINLGAAKSAANQLAVADIVIDGAVLIANVPVTTLLDLERELKNLQTFVEKMCELDPSERWTQDVTTGLMRSEPSKTHRTKKMQRPIVKYDATEHHPAQTEMVSEDVVVGHWTTTKFSGAISQVEKRAILARLDKLQEAVIKARQEANSQTVVDSTIGDIVLGCVFG